MSEFTSIQPLNCETFRIVSAKLSQTHTVQFAAVRPPRCMSSNTLRLQFEITRPSMTIISSWRFGIVFSLAKPKRKPPKRAVYSRTIANRRKIQCPIDQRFLLLDRMSRSYARARSSYPSCKSRGWSLIATFTKSASRWSIYLTGAFPQACICAAFARCRR